MRGASTSSPVPTPRSRGSTTSAARSTSGSSRTPRAATPSTATPGSAGSPATATTTRRSTSAAATSTSATTTRGDYWSPSWQPTQRELEDYTCRHGLGYSIIASRYHGIRAETLYFVPAGETLEIWRVRVTNERAEPAKLSLFSSVEFCLWDAQDDATNFQRNYSVGEVEVEDGVIYHKTEYRERRDHFAFFACSEPLAGFDTQRDAFLGPYRGWDRPIAVERGAAVRLDRPRLAAVGLPSRPPRDGPRGDEGSALRARLCREPPRREVRSARIADDQQAAASGRPSPGTCAATWSPGRSRRCGHGGPTSSDTFQVRTGNEHVDRMVNIWNAYQCMVTFNMSRSASLFESGIGRGMGFRDSNQDLLGFVHMIPARARERLLDLAVDAAADGRRLSPVPAAHQARQQRHRLGVQRRPGLARARRCRVPQGDRRLGRSSTRPCPTTTSPAPSARSTSISSVASSTRSSACGPHGLPLIGRADWNDCLNLNCFSETPGESFQTTENRHGGVAESVFIAGLFVLAADELAEIADPPRRRRRESPLYRPRPRRWAT